MSTLVTLSLADSRICNGMRCCDLRDGSAWILERIEENSLHIP
jgi:hypothetical protein